MVIPLSTHDKRLQVKHDYNIRVLIAIIRYIPPAPALAAVGHTGALLLHQADVGAPLRGRPVPLWFL